MSAIDPGEVTLKYRSLHVRQCDILLFALDPALRAGGCEKFGPCADDVFVDEERLLTRPNKHSDLVGEIAGSTTNVRASLEEVFWHLRQGSLSELGIVILLLLLLLNRLFRVGRHCWGCLCGSGSWMVCVEDGSAVLWLSLAQ